MNFIKFGLICIFWFAKIIHCLIEPDSLNELEDSDHVIEVSNENYELLSSGIRDTFSVLYITMRGSNSQGGECELCSVFEDTYREVIATIRSQHADLNVKYFVADVSINNKLVADLKLQYVPHLIVFPPTENEDFNWKLGQFYQYELTEKVGSDELRLADFLGRTLNVLVSVQEPFDYQEFLIYFSLCMILFVVTKKFILPAITNKSRFFSGLFAFSVILLSITGWTFTQIKGIPFIARNAENQIMYFSGGMSWQFGLEIFTMSLMYIALGTLTLILIYVPKMSIDSIYQDLITATISCVLLYAFSYYISIFLIKNPGYVYSF